jgi:hypothetical protein
LRRRHSIIRAPVRSAVFHNGHSSHNYSTLYQWSRIHTRPTTDWSSTISIQILANLPLSTFTIFISTLMGVPNTEATARGN